MADIKLIRAFLEPQHIDFAARAHAFAQSEIGPRPPPPDDSTARTEARALLAALGHGDWLRPIFDLDLRSCCLMREALGETSPLADAIFALQGLGTTPILIAGSPRSRIAGCGRSPEAR